jgi:hypothetical protein
MGGGGGGDFLRGNIFFRTPIEEIYFFSHLMAGNIFLSEIYRPIFQARNFFLHYAWEDYLFP